MIKRKKQEKDKLNACEQALEWITEFYYNVSDGTTGGAGAMRNQQYATEQLKILYEGSYKEDLMNKAIEQLIVKLKVNLAAILTEESDLDEKEKQAAQIIAAMKPFADKFIEDSKKREKSEELPPLTREDIKPLIENLKMLLPLLKEEIDVTKTMKALDTRLRKLARELEKTE